MIVSEELAAAVDAWFEALTKKTPKDAIAAKHDVEVLVRLHYQDYSRRQKMYDKIVREIVERLDKYEEAHRTDSVDDRG